MVDVAKAVSEAVMRMTDRGQSEHSTRNMRGGTMSLHKSRSRSARIRCESGQDSNEDDIDWGKSVRSMLNSLHAIITSRA